VIVSSIEAIASMLDTQHGYPVYVNEMKQNTQIPCFFIYATPLESSWVSRDMKKWRILFEIRFYHDEYLSRYEMAETFVDTFSKVGVLPCLKGQSVWGDSYIAYRFQIETVVTTKDFDSHDYIKNITFDKKIEQ
jgi:hypothetical protein